MIRLTFTHKRRCPFTVVIGFKFQIGGMWVGYHWSAFNRRVCINLIPCCTVWVMLPGGKEAP